jgi:hypothetical protein
MPELMRRRVLGLAATDGPRPWMRSRWWLACVASLTALPALVHAADPLPASVRACAAIPDVLQRLSCYDREVARYPAPQAKSSAAMGAPAATSPTSAPSPQAAAKVVTPPAASDAGAAAADSAQHVVAHLVSIERLPSEMILHLDNGQVWQEVQTVSGDLSLKEGDAVTIDRHFGSYWLTGPHVSSMKVRQKS